MDREVMNLRDSLITRYSTLVYNGFWFAPERLALQALVTESEERIRYGAREAVQRQHYRRRREESGQSVQPGYCYDGSRSNASL